MPEYIEGRNALSADIVDRNDTLVGPGPLLTCLDLTFDQTLNHAGNFTARFPANDPRLAYLRIKRHFLDFHLDGQPFFFGLVESWTLDTDENGEQMLVVSGRDALAELAETSISFLEITAEGLPVKFVPSLIIGQYNIAANGPLWSNDNAGQTETAVYGSFSGESALSALSRVAEQIGESFRLGPFRRSIEWLGTSATSSGVRAVGGSGDPIRAEDNDVLCFITSLSERRDASRMITKIHPYGSGFGEARLDLSGTTLPLELGWPAGYTYNEADNSIQSDVALAYVGKSIARHVNFKDIRPLYNTDADIVAAKNYLAFAALAYLQRNDSVDDVVAYELSVVKLPAHVKVGMTLRVVYQDDRFDLDLDLNILGIRTTINRDGAISYNLTVAHINQWRLREASHTVAQLEEGEIFAAHPQIDSNSYWENFKEVVGPDQIDHMAEFPFFLGAEVVTIRQVLFRFKVEPILAPVIEYTVGAQTGQNDAENTGGTNTTATQGTNTAATQGTNTAATQGTNTAQTGDTTTTATLGTNTPNTSPTSVTIDPTSGIIETDDATPNTGGPLPSQLTDTNYAGLATATQGELSANPAEHWHDIGTHQHEHNHTHVVDAHAHGIPHHGHSNAEHSHPMPHTHNMPHAHNMPHTHNMPHDHNMPHTHNMPHDHPSPQHVHPAPTFTPTHKLVRFAVIDSFTIADLEYSVNGGAWFTLDSATPTLGGFFEIDITEQIQQNVTLRPLQEWNVVQVRSKTITGPGTSAQLTVKLGVRTTVQSIAFFN